MVSVHGKCGLFGLLAPPPHLLKSCITSEHCFSDVGNFSAKPLNKDNYQKSFRPVSLTVDDKM